MDNKQFSEKWPQLKEKIKQKWPKFSDQDLQSVKGDLNLFLKELQNKYGISRDKAEQEIQTMVKGEGAGVGAQGSSQNRSSQEAGQRGKNQQGRNAKR